MDNIAQLMRFSPTHSVIYRKRKPEWAFGEYFRKLNTLGSV